METYEVILASGQMYRVKGMSIHWDKDTGQTIIYDGNHHGVNAVIPPTATVHKINKEEEIK